MNSGKLHLGDVSFDLSTRELSLKDGRPAQLRNKSRAVLVYLASNPDRTVTKDEVIGAVWHDVAVSDESLVQCIADIRRAIGADAKSIVETVPREGYRLNPQVNRPHALGGKRRVPMLALAVLPLLAIAAWLMLREAADTPAIVATPGAGVEADAAMPGTKSVEAYLEVLKGRASANLFDKDESLVAERHFRRAIELDPAYARAYAELGTVFAVRIENDWTVLKAEDRDKALYYAETALVLDPDLWLGHYALGRLQSVLGDFDKAEAHLRRAMALQPEDEDSRAYFAVVKIMQGDAAEGLRILEPTVKSHPDPPFWYYLSLGHAYYELGQTAKAEQSFLTCLELAPNSPYCMRFLIAVYAEQGLLAEARAARASYEALGFDASVETLVELMMLFAPTDEERLRKAYRSVGLPP